MKYTIDYTNNFKKQYKKIKKQGKDLSKLHEIIEKLANGEKLDDKYRNHKLIDNNFSKAVMNAIYHQIGYLFTD